MPDKYGLTRSEFYKIIDILKYYSNIIEQVILFGSRARGDYKKTSDIDIAVKFKNNNSSKISEIIEAIEKIDMIYTFDIIDYSKISNEKLKKYIDQEGKIIFLTDEKGGVLLNINKIKDKLNDLKRALKKLNESVKRDPSRDDIVIDATIKRFEFTYELSWKLMKSYLEYNGNLEATSPRKAIKEAFKEGLINDGELWLMMLQDRNRTSHTYDEECALEILQNIKNMYLDLIEKFVKRMEKEIEK